MGREGCSPAVILEERGGARSHSRSMVKGTKRGSKDA